MKATERLRRRGLGGVLDARLSAICAGEGAGIEGQGGAAPATVAGQTGTVGADAVAAAFNPAMAPAGIAHSTPQYRRRQ